jgi:hypothetical protein
MPIAPAKRVCYPPTTCPKITIQGDFWAVDKVPCPKIARIHGVLKIFPRALGVIARTLGIIARVLGVIARVLGVTVRTLGVIARVLGITARVLGIIARAAKALGVANWGS